VAGEQEAQARAEGQAEALDRVARRADGGAYGGEVRLHAALHQGEEEAVLGGVPVVEAARQHARGARDLAHRRGREALRAEEAGGGVEEAVLDRPGRFPGFGHATKKLPTAGNPVKQALAARPSRPSGPLTPRRRGA